MKIVLDANIFYQSPRLDKPSFQELFAVLEKTSDSLVIPEIVFEEVVNTYSEKLIEKEERLKTEINKLNGMLWGKSVEINYGEVVLSEEVNSYRNMLDEAIKKHGYIIPIPDIPHRSLLNRALERRKPFSEKGKGYRDTLIWESILKMIEDYPNERFVFVSQNSKDFAQDDLLHPDLEDDIDRLKIKGVSKDNLSFVKNLEALVEEELRPRLEKLVEIEEKIQNGEFAGINFDQVYENYLHELVAVQFIDELPTNLPRAFQRVSIASMAPGYDIDLATLDARELSEKKISLTIGITGKARLECAVNSYYLGMFESQNSVEIILRDWEPDIAFIALNIEIQMKVRAVFSQNFNAFTSAEIVEITFPNIYNELDLSRIGELGSVPSNLSDIIHGSINLQKSIQISPALQGLVEIQRQFSDIAAVQSSGILKQTEAIRKAVANNVAVSIEPLLASAGLQQLQELVMGISAEIAKNLVSPESLEIIRKSISATQNIEGSIQSDSGPSVSPSNMSHNEDFDPEENE